MEVNSLQAANQSYTTPVQAQKPQPEAPKSAFAPVKVEETPKTQKKQDIHLPKLQTYEQPESLGEKAMNEMMNRAIIEANKKLEPIRSELSYSVHKVTKDIMVVVKNSDTQEVIREIPPEKTLDAIAKVWELIGLLVDKEG